MHRVHIKSELVTGFFPVTVCNVLPIKEIKFLMDNDVAGARVTPTLDELDTPQRTETTRSEEVGTEIETVIDAKSP